MESIINSPPSSESDLHRIVKEIPVNPQLQDGAMNDTTEHVVESLDQITSELEWNRLLLHGSLPAPRYKHAAVAVGRNMFVTGGITPQGRLNDVQVFHAEKLTWESLGCRSPFSDLKVTPGEQQDVPCRSCTGHSLVFWENQFVLVGCQAKSASKTVMVFSLNLSSRSWSALSPKGNVPAARTGHTVIQMASMLVLFGGEDMKGHTLNDIYILELKTLLWLPLETSGAKPSPRRDHCAASYSERYLWIFGGKSKTVHYNDTYCLDFKNMEWTKGKTRARSPMARAGHSGTVAGNKWYIVGGESRGNEVLKMLVFNLDAHEWLELANIRSGSPLGHDGISLVNIQSKGRTFAVAFGGHDGKPSDQIYVMLLPSTTESMAQTMSGTSSGRNSFNSVHSEKPMVRGPESPLSVRTSNASSGDGSTAESTFSLGDIGVRPYKQDSATGGSADQEVDSPQGNEERIPDRQAVSTTTTANDEEAEYQTDRASHDEQHILPEGVHPVQMEEKLSSPARNSGELSDKGSPGIVSTSRNLDPDPPNGMHECDISGDLNERLLKLNDDLQNRLAQTHDARVELEQALHTNLMYTEDLEQKVLNLFQSKAEEDWKLEEARQKLEELERKLNSPSVVQQDADSKSQSMSREEERTAKPNSLRTKLFEESVFNLDTDTTYETHRRLEEAETNMSALRNSNHLTESKLQIAIREKRELSEKAATATRMMEEARSTNKNLRAENLRLEQELLAMRATLAAVKATLENTQEELQEKQLELSQATARNIDLQVEMHELSHKFSGT